MPRYNQIVSKFAIEGDVKEVTPLGEGFINDTFIVNTLGESHNYILQRKNHNIFKDVPSMMQNIELVTNHLKGKVISRGGDPLREVLTITKTTDGKNYYIDAEGNYWTMCIRISNSVTFDKANSLELCYKGGVGIGRFQSDLVDFSTQLTETIKGFHNMRWRFQQWDQAIAENKAGRVEAL